jgi:hypothetical protein
MRFLPSPTACVAATAVLFSSVTLAQNNTQAPPGSVLTHVVQVGDANGSLAFYPAELTGVKAGDMVQFHFWPKVSIGILSNLFTTEELTLINH